MAKETVIKLIDDVDGGVAHETLHLALDRQTVELDLSSKNAKVLRTVLQPYLNAGSPVTPPPAAEAKRPEVSPAPRRSDESARIREWAEAQGYQVAPKGRIKQNYVDEYHAAH